MSESSASHEVVDVATRRELSWIAERQADFSDFILNMSPELAKKGCWGAMRNVIEKLAHGNPKAIENGQFAQMLRPYVDGLRRLDTDSETLLSLGAQLVRQQLVGPLMYYDGAALIAALFESPEIFMGELKAMPSEDGRQHGLRGEAKRKVAAMIDDGLSTPAIARKLSIGIIETWGRIRASSLAPTETIHWLTEIRSTEIATLLSDGFGLMLIAEQYRLCQEDVLLLVTNSQRLRQAYIQAHHCGIMHDKKRRIKDAVIARWPCKYAAIKERDQETCDWIERRDPLWVNQFSRFINNRGGSLNGDFVNNFEDISHLENELISRLLSKGWLSCPVPPQISAASMYRDDSVLFVPEDCAVADE